MRARQPGMALFACVVATLAACGQAFTPGGPSDGGDDGSSDSPSAPDATDAASGDTTADGIGHDAPAHDGLPTPDAPSSDGVSGDVVVGSSKLVFITSQLYNGDLGGLDGADTLCQSLAARAGRTGTFKAWLSSTTSTAGQRLTHSMAPYVRPDGMQVAADWTGLTSGTLVHPINVTESDGSPPAATVKCSSTNVAAAWTSTSPDGGLGTTLGATCSNWSTFGISTGAILGVADQTGGAWSNGCGTEQAGGSAAICQQTASLYCIEQ